LDSQLLQMAEMVASLIPNKKVKKQAKDKLDKAFPSLLSKTVPETSAFFLSQNVSDRNAIELTYSALKAFDVYKKNVDYE